MTRKFLSWILCFYLLPQFCFAHEATDPWIEGFEDGFAYGARLPGAKPASSSEQAYREGFSKGYPSGASFALRIKVPSMQDVPIQRGDGLNRLSRNLQLSGQGLGEGVMEVSPELLRALEQLRLQETTSPGADFNQQRFHMGGSSGGSIGAISR